jgi:spermidine/putrescine transport system permease protein
MSDRLIRIGLAAYMLLAFAFIFAPFVTMIVFAFNESRFPYLPWQGFSLTWFSALSDPQVKAAIRNSLIVASASAAIATPLGCAAAYFVNRWEFPGKNAYIGFIVSPPCIPLVILALIMLIYFREIGLTKSLLSVILAHVVLTAPFAFGVMRLRLNDLDPNLEQAAWNLGASEWHAIRTVVLPQAAAAVAAAFLLSMVVSWDEFIVAWLVSGLEVTLPVYLWVKFQGQISAHVNAIGTLAFGVSISVVILVEFLIFRAGRKYRSDAKRRYEAH